MGEKAKHEQETDCILHCFVSHHCQSLRFWGVTITVTVTFMYYSIEVPLKMYKIMKWFAKLAQYKI